MIRETQQTKLDSVWLKASVLGGLWASVEIIIGSFFHNLRIPFAGTILAANATVLMVAFYQVWPEKGLVWRAGLITALMKSISPSAVILGPMIGIMTEALIMEMFIRFFGNNLLSLGVAGALSVSSALIHKVSSLVILYGFNIVTIFIDIFQFLARQLKIENARPIDVLVPVCAIYLGFGLISAFTGYFIGKRSNKREVEKQGFEPEKINAKNILAINPDQHFSITWFFIHIILIPLGLLIMNFCDLIISITFVLVYSSICVYKYKRSLRRLLKPIFWWQLILIMLIASVNWKGIMAEGPYFEIDGLIMGFEMTLRAIFVVIAFSSFSVELRNPGIREMLFKRGFDQIYSSLGLAFSALPVMIEAMPKPKFLFRHPIISFTSMMNHAREWLIIFETSAEKK
jgi:hypothetical protein